MKGELPPAGEAGLTGRFARPTLRVPLLGSSSVPPLARGTRSGHGRREPAGEREVKVKACTTAGKIKITKRFHKNIRPSILF